MLGLNRTKTRYTITAYYYEFIGLKGNTQVFADIPKKFKCSFGLSSTIERIGKNQGQSLRGMSIETDSSINFKENDKIVINGMTMLVKSQLIENDPFSGKYTNKPRTFIKYLELQ